MGADCNTGCDHDLRFDAVRRVKTLPFATEQHRIVAGLARGIDPRIVAIPPSRLHQHLPEGSHAGRCFWIAAPIVGWNHKARPPCLARIPDRDDLLRFRDGPAEPPLDGACW
jgi:hypothetical protein